MKDTLRVTIVQSHLHWENPIANRDMFSEKISGLQSETDLVILPEMFTTGFSMNAAALAEKEEGPTLDWMQEIAKSLNAAVTGSVIISENEEFYNRLLFVQPDGAFESYDKRHTFTLAGEHKIFSKGNERRIIDFRGWKICPLICYDLRFPVWARNTEDYELLLYVANWPKKRVAAWDALLKARAIENMSYCVGVNRVGLDGNGHEYTGHSGVFDPLGEQLHSNTDEKEFIETISLSKAYLTNTREKLQFLNDRDSFSLD